MDKYIIGCLSGMTATLCIQPIDYMKVKCQINPNISKIELTKNLYKLNGIKSFYNGLNIALLRQSVYGTIRLGLFQDLKDNYKFHPITSAVIAATIGTIINNPIDYLLVKKQTEQNFSITNIIKKEKLNILLFTGLKYNLLRAISVNIGFGSKTIYEDKLKKYNNNNNFIKPISIISASITSAAISMPFDVMRTYSQKNISFKNDIVNIKNNKNFYIVAIKKIYHSFPIYFMRIAPHSIISLTCLDLYNNIYNNYKKNYI
jgi:solute carrier family 25 oxoglutarate transporter 11